MLRLKKSFILIILVMFLGISILSFFLKVESIGLIYGIISFVLLVDKDIKIYDYLFVISLLLGTIITFINIFIKNIYLSNVYSIYICALSLCIFYMKYRKNKGE